MSLLIKALHKAEQEKASEATSRTSAAATSFEATSFELAPKENSLELEAGLSGTESVKPVSQTAPPPSRAAAGVVFAAKSAPGSTSTQVLLLAGAVLLILVAGAFYYYLESLKQPELVMPARVVEVIPTVDTAGSVSPGEADLLEPEGLSPDEVEVDMISAGIADTRDEIERPPVNDGFSLGAATVRSQSRVSPVVYGEPVATAEDNGVKVTRNNPPPAINPNLATAYAAFNAGDDAAAQASYRKVLQGDIRSTDALLGMAAVALRQGRQNDALGWYGKVLEVEPRNSFAQAAMASLIGQVDPVSSESRIKSLIAVQPDAAHLHATLGNIYADRGQWAQAQQAYFEAHRLDASNAEHAFNLAVSLDQLGKASLALQYYRQALSLLGSRSSGAIDLAALELRITQLQ
jgi:tetratricopeptide (TPR) repeat protein